MGAKEGCFQSDYSQPAGLPFERAIGSTVRCVYSTAIDNSKRYCNRSIAPPPYDGPPFIAESGEKTL